MPILHRNHKKDLVSKGRMSVRFADLTHNLLEIFVAGVHVDLDDPKTNEK